MAAALPFILAAATVAGTAATIVGAKNQSKNSALALAQQKKAQEVQQRSIFAAQEDQAQLSAEQVASGRRLRSVGRQQLAFQGNTLGVPPDLNGGAAPAGA